MTSKHSLALRSIAILLVLSLVQVFVLANPSRVHVGRLVTNSGSFVIVNGNEARTGTTILSGTSLQTPAGVAATVQLGSLGSVDISPGTTLTLSFGEGNVAVDVSAGQAFLFTGDGVKGSIKTPEDELFRTEVGSAPAQSGSEVQKCLARAKREYQSAIRPAHKQLLEAKREADKAYKLAIRADKSKAAREAAENARRAAIKQAEDEYREAIKPAEEALRQAEIACKYRRPETPSESTEARTYPQPSFWKIFLIGLPIISGSVLLASLVPCGRGSNPSPGTPNGLNDQCR